MKKETNSKDQSKIEPKEIKSEPNVDQTAKEENVDNIEVKYANCLKDNIYFKIPTTGWFLLGFLSITCVSYFGIKSLLTLYFKNHLGLSGNVSRTIFHLFPLVSFIGNLVGAFFSDNYFGKLKTSFLFSIVYIIGIVALPFVSMSTSVWLSICVLLIFNFGNGSFRGTLLPFYGDQIPEDPKVLIDVFYSLVYLAVNVGAIIGIYINPELSELKCQGRDQCYPAAFGACAAIFILSAIILAIPYKRYVDVPNQDRALSRFLGCTANAIFNWIKAKPKDQQSFVDYADSETYSEEFKTDVKQTLKVFWYFIPLPIFWALFDQQGSSWPLQGERMNEYVFTTQQLQLLNPLLVVFLIPFYNNILYPVLGKLKILQSSNSRVLVGYLFASSSFIYSGFLQISIENSFPAPLSSDVYNINFLNNGNESIEILNSKDKLLIPPLSFGAFTIGKNEIGTTLQTVSGNQYTIPFLDTECLPGSSCTIVFTRNKCPEEIPVSEVDKKWENSFKSSFIRLIFDNCMNKDNLTIETKLNNIYEKLFTVEPNSETILFSNYTRLKKGNEYRLIIRLNDDEPIEIDTLEIFTLKVMTVFIHREKDGSFKVVQNIENELKAVSLLLQIPQYVLITIGEVFLSVTISVFAYKQAPVALKTLVSTCFALTVVGGNLIIAFIATFESSSNAMWEYFGFAIACSLAGVLNVLLGYFLRFKD